MSLAKKICWFVLDLLISSYWWIVLLVVLLWATSKSPSEFHSACITLGMVAMMLILDEVQLLKQEVKRLNNK